jgi:hypothetical protein
MQISIPNENGVLAPGHTEIVARQGRSNAAVHLALAEDRRYRYAVSLSYSYGGFGGPIRDDDEGYADVRSAKEAALAELWRKWHRPYPSDPQSVHDELRLMGEQIERQLWQPTLF